MNQKKPLRKLGLVLKYTKRKIKYGWTGHSSLKRRLVRLSDQVSIAFWPCSLGVRLRFAQANSWQKQHCCSLTLRLRFAQANCVQNELGTFAWGSLRRHLSEHSSFQKNKLRISKPIFPNTPILILSHSKLVPNQVYRSCT